jgi:hypothetical protein
MFFPEIINISRLVADLDVILQIKWMPNESHFDLRLFNSITVYITL